MAINRYDNKGNSSGRAGFTANAPSDEMKKLVANIKLSNPMATLFSDIAQKLAEECNRGSKDANKTTQIRRFYDELVMWNEKIQYSDSAEEKFKELEPFVQMLRAKVAYAEGRKLVNKNFTLMFDTIIKQSTNAKTLNNGKLLFEAFLGFKKGLE